MKLGFVAYTFNSASSLSLFLSEYTYYIYLVLSSYKEFQVTWTNIML